MDISMDIHIHGKPESRAQPRLQTHFHAFWAFKMRPMVTLLVRCVQCKWLFGYLSS